MSDNVAIVIVSHSTLVAQGAKDMAQQMVGDDVKLFACGGTEDGQLGTNVAAISAAFEEAYSDKGVLVIVDLGGAEINSEVAISMLPEEKRSNVRLCDAAIVEGTIMAATEASSGASLSQVCAAAEEYR